ncbi:hypothetical protein [Nitrosopumilus ureiphilus]|jgi:uncharacterized membrane protein|uniref:SHOCT domain-containing protein n=1 Tax=Nitrosopumilus ureiphilus TaxID=1470067 RepID=A0A7D5RF03_9ARCH|nr:hypothetical protein [Nitrosopumilus ureiphilus]QLH07443.1 hypothetical protein C5F50_10460 [Nitrosopumilus ureiphilus]
MSDSYLRLKCNKCDSPKLVMMEELVCTNCGSKDWGFLVDENNPLDVLKMQLVKGDISRNEYEKMKKELQNGK